VPELRGQNDATSLAGAPRNSREGDDPDEERSAHSSGGLGRATSPVPRGGMRDDTYLPGVLPMGELAARRLLQQRILLLDGELDDQGGTRLTSQLLVII
jgi:hypothetical protein